MKNALENKRYYILFISIEGKKSITETKFYQYIGDNIKGYIGDTFRYEVICFDHFSIYNENKRNNPIYNKLQSRKLIILETNKLIDNDCNNENHFFVIHDGDFSNQTKKTLDELWNYIKESIKEIFSDFNITTIKRIYDNNKGFDYFLYELLFPNIDIKKVTTNQIKEFVKEYKIKKENDNTYIKKLRESIKEEPNWNKQNHCKILINRCLSSKSSHSEIFKILKQIISN